jgi:hypothetical protein
MDGQGAGVLCGVNPPVDTNSLGTGKGYRCTDPYYRRRTALIPIDFHLVAIVKPIEDARQIHHRRDTATIAPWET